MNVYKGLTNLPVFKNPVVTIGSFDGIHVGHRKIIEQINQIAQNIDGESVVITFNPHPRLVLNNNAQPIYLLNTIDEKISALEKLNINHLVVVPFTKSFSEISAQAYIEDFLVKNFHPHTLVIGYDHHFGKDRSGNINLLQQMQHTFDYELKEIPVQEIEHISISSTKIREALLLGDVQKANQYLCNNFSVFGKVVHGEQKGRLLGFPTANIQVIDYNKLIPANGVYIVNVYIAGQQYRGMMNIGTRPTIAEKNTLSLEVNIFNLHQDLYGQYITIEFLNKIRNEQKFNSVNDLIAQLQHDKLVAEAY